MGDSIRSILKTILRDARLRPHIVNLILNQANWSQMRLCCVVLLLQSLGEEFVS